jgi:hypothetical protein
LTRWGLAAWPDGNSAIALAAQSGEHLTLVRENRYDGNEGMKVGKRVRFKLYMGREVEGVIKAILKETSGTKLIGVRQGQFRGED